jgi:hypothetical protein
MPSPYGHCYKTAHINRPLPWKERKKTSENPSSAFFCKVSSLRESRVVTASSSAEKGESPEPDASGEFSDGRQQAASE